MVHINRFHLVTTVVVVYFLISLTVSQAAVGNRTTEASLALQGTPEATQEPDPLEANKKLLGRIYDVFTNGNVDELDEFVATDFVDHTPGTSPGGRRRFPPASSRTRRSTGPIASRASTG